MKDNIIISDSKKKHIIPVEEILRMEANGNYTTVFLRNNITYVSTKNLNEIFKDLNPNNFFRVHKSHIINLKEVKSYQKGRGGFVNMSNGYDVVVACRRKTILLKQLGMKWRDNH